MKTAKMNSNSSLESLMAFARQAVAVIFLTMIAIPNQAFAGGMHSGGGPGVATYRPGAAKTPDNLLFVESLALFKARAEGKMPALNPQKDLGETGTIDAALDSATAMKKIRKMLVAASPEFYAQFALADEKFSEKLKQAADKYELSKSVTSNGAPVTASLELIRDFGDLPALGSNQEFVQVIHRLGENFGFDMRLWLKMPALDRLDTRIHEAAYAISWQNSSVNIQKFQLAVLQHYLENREFSQEEFRRLAEQEWGFVQVKSNAHQSRINGLRIADDADRPYKGLLKEEWLAGNRIVYFFPYNARETLRCGVLLHESGEGLYEGASSRAWFIYQDGIKSREALVNLSRKESAVFAKFQQEADEIIRSRLNPLTTPALTNFAAVACFEKALFGVGALRYLEFRKGVIGEPQQTNPNAGLDLEIEFALLAKTRVVLGRLAQLPLGSTSEQEVFLSKFKAAVRELTDLVYSLDLVPWLMNQTLAAIYNEARFKIADLKVRIPVGTFYRFDADDLQLSLFEKAREATKKMPTYSPPEALYLQPRKIVGALGAYID